MTAGMSPLERRYRRLLRLLPAEHRGTRGEELLGLLMDLDGHRRHPSPQESLSVVALAIRLRLDAVRTPPAAVASASVVLSALLIAFDTQDAAMTIDLFTSSDFASARQANIADWPLIAGYALLSLTPAVAWLLGATRTALALHSGFLATYVAHATRPISGMDTSHKLLPFAVPVAIFVLLTIAAIRRWTAPRPRVFWWALVPASIAAWIGTHEWDGYGVSIPAAVSTILALIVAVTVAVGAMVSTRRHPLAVVIVAGLGGFTAGWLISDLIFTDMWFLQHVGYSLPLATLIGGLAPVPAGISRLAGLRRRDAPLISP